MPKSFWQNDNFVNLVIFTVCFFKYGFDAYTEYQLMPERFLKFSKLTITVRGYLIGIACCPFVFTGCFKMIHLVRNMQSLKPYPNCMQELQKQNKNQMRTKSVSESIIDNDLSHMFWDDFYKSYVYQSKKISNDQELIQSDPISCPQNQKGNN